MRTATSPMLYTLLREPFSRNDYLYELKLDGYRIISFIHNPSVVMKVCMEGIVAKRRDNEYVQGTRSFDWYKIPTQIGQEFIIGGWAESENGR